MSVSHLAAELDTIYNKTFGRGLKTLAVCSANPLEGVTSVINALAEKVLLSGKSVLVVDLNLYHPAFNQVLSVTDQDVEWYPCSSEHRQGSDSYNDCDSFYVDEGDKSSQFADFTNTITNTISMNNFSSSNNSFSLNSKSDKNDNLDITCFYPDISKKDLNGLLPQLVNVKEQEGTFLGIKAPHDKHIIQAMKNSEVLKYFISHWLIHFDHIIFDTSPINRINGGNIPATTVAQVCDGAVFVVMAGLTTKEQCQSAAKKIQSAEVNLVGSVYNDYRNPSLKYELLRELHRLPKCLSWLRNTVSQWIKNSKFLAVEL